MKYYLFYWILHYFGLSKILIGLWRFFLIFRLEKHGVYLKKSRHEAKFTFRYNVHAVKRKVGRLGYDRLVLPSSFGQNVAKVQAVLDNCATVDGRTQQ